MSEPEIPPGPITPRAFLEKAQAFHAAHRELNTDVLISNVRADIAQIEASALPFPITVNHGGSQNAWITSPLTTYGAYALEEVHHTAPRLMRGPLAGVVRGAELMMRAAHFDRAVCVNNWLVSTNLYPGARSIDLHSILHECTQRWPGHAIWFRSLNEHHHTDWLGMLTAYGLDLIPTRQVYLYRDIRTSCASRQNFQRDQHLLNHTAYRQREHSTFTAADFERAVELYRLLYLDKYSSLNPRYSATFLSKWVNAGLLQLTGFDDENGVLQAVLGIFTIGEVMTAPIVGYNTALPFRDGLYRLLMARAMHNAMVGGKELNLSAGAAHFKRLRGGIASIEYSAVFSAHLPTATRLALRALQGVTTRIGIPVMKRFKL